jgi:hypothetical protein
MTNTLVENGYCTLADLIAFMPTATAVNITSLAEQAINAASRMIDATAGCEFYPSVKTNKYNTPRGAELKLHDNLLEMLTLTNGDASVIASTDYDLWPYNSDPKASIILKSLSTVYFNQSTGNAWEQAAVSVKGVFAFHSDYARAWRTGANLAAAMNDTTTGTMTFALNSPYVAGQVVRCQDEIFRVLSVASSSAADTVTVDRGWNGSTAATHVITTPVKIWSPEAPIVRATLIQAARYYRRGEAIWGTTGGGEMGVQPVAIPKLDPDVEMIAKNYQSRF